jgi:hypothetical protein
MTRTHAATVIGIGCDTLLEVGTDAATVVELAVGELTVGELEAAGGFLVIEDK